MRLNNFLNYFKFRSAPLYHFIFFYLNFFKWSNLNKHLFLTVDSDKIFFVTKFLNLCSNFQLKVFNDLCVVDYYNKKFRYKIIYNFSSLSFGYRFFLISFLKENNLFLSSLTSIFESSNWLEREVWDLFGIFFTQHPDLRRILTDYGFKGYPFRKDFPLTGYVELRFDDLKGDIVYEPVSLTQELRFFNFSSSWESDN